MIGGGPPAFQEYESGALLLSHVDIQSRVFHVTRLKKESPQRTRSGRMKSGLSRITLAQKDSDQIYWLL